MFVLSMSHTILSMVPVQSAADYKDDRAGRV